MEAITNIVILVHDRPRLTKQCLSSIVSNTNQDDYRLLCVDDASAAETQAVLAEFVRPNIRVVRYETPVGIIGALRNAGAASAEWTFGTPKYVCFLDNDVFVEPNWLETMQNRMMGAGIKYGARVLGGYQHPFHGTKQDWGIYHEVDAVAGYSMFMDWETWKQFRPFVATQSGVGASEDWEFCQRIIRHEGTVGYVHPPVLYHCGITNSNGQAAVGAEHFRRAEGILFE